MPAAFYASPRFLCSPRLLCWPLVALRTLSCPLKCCNCLLFHCGRTKSCARHLQHQAQYPPWSSTWPPPQVQAPSPASTKASFCSAFAPSHPSHLQLTTLTSLVIYHHHLSSSIASHLVPSITQSHHAIPSKSTFFFRRFSRRVSTLSSTVPAFSCLDALVGS